MVPEMPAWLEMISALARLRPPHLLVTCCYQEGLPATGRLAENMMRTPAPMFECPQEARQEPAKERVRRPVNLLG